jgi:hypothetical protein
MKAMSDPRILKLTFGEIAELALRQIEADERKPDGGKRFRDITARLAKIDNPIGWYAGKLIGENGNQSISIGPFKAKEHFESTICEVWDGNYRAKPNADFIANAPADIAYLLSQ